MEGEISFFSLSTIVKVCECIDYFLILYNQNKKMNKMKEIAFPALGEFIETIMKRKKIITVPFRKVRHMGGDYCTKMKKGMI